MGISPIIAGQSGPGFAVRLDEHPDGGWLLAQVPATLCECHHVVQGLTEFQDLDDGAVQRCASGETCAITPGTRYAQRIKRDTRILVVRMAAQPALQDPSSPHGPDIAASARAGAPSPPPGLTAAQADAALAWAREPLRVQRLDLHDASAPQATRVVPAAAAALVDADRRVLLVRRRDSGNWALPGGTLEADEDLAACVLREVHEETGLAAEVVGIVGTYSNPVHRVAYSDGEVRREFSIVFRCRPAGTQLRMDDESTDLRWVAFEELDALPMAASQRLRLRDLQAHLLTGQLFVR